MKKAMLALAVTLAIPVAHTAGQGADPIIGTWELRQNVAKCDGKGYPATGHPTADTMAYTKIDSHTSQAVLKKAGKVIITNTRVVSKDGKMFTLTDNATGSEGKLVSNVLVFDRR